MWPKQKCEWAWNVFVTAAFEYDTPKIVHIQNKKVGVLYRLFQLGIVGFMIGSVRLPFVIFCYFMYAIPLCVCVVCVCVRVCVCACVCVCVCFFETGTVSYTRRATRIRSR